jgi:hypothetical protein
MAPTEAEKCSCNPAAFILDELTGMLLMFDILTPSNMVNDQKAETGAKPSA